MSRARALRIAAIVIAIGAAAVVYVVTQSDNDTPEVPALLACTTDSIGEPNYATAAAPPPGVALSLVAEIADPTDVAVRSGDPGLYIASRIGTVYRVEGDAAEVVLDVGELNVASQGGLMSMTFDPTGEYLYVNYTLDLVNFVMAHEVTGAGEVSDTGVEILSVQQPIEIHNFGTITFGPDGHLYIASGDGGSPEGKPDTRLDGQNLGTIFGGILRIEPDPAAGGYSIPSDNPFVDVAGARGELWTYGLRNPWKFSFDDASGDLWIGDVGQYCWEEVTYSPAASAAGSNFGWSGYEGFHVAVDDPPSDHVLPVHEYQRGTGDDGVTYCAVIGGFVYHGAALPELRGAYVFADWCAQQVETLRLRPDGSVEHQVLATGPDRIQAVARDHDGELLFLDGSAVHRLVPAS